MKNSKKIRLLKRIKNRDRVNRLKNQQGMKVPLIMLPLFILVFIRLGLEKQNTAEKLLARLRLHIEKLTGNLNFPVTDPTIANLQTMADALQADIDAIAAGNKALIPHRLNLERDAREMIRQLSYNIQFLSEGDEEEIKSAGFDVRKSPSPVPAPGQVVGLMAQPVGPGKIKLKWNKDAYSKFYFIEGNANPSMPGPWQIISKTTRVTFVVEELNPGTVYYLRVFGSNGDEDGNPSDYVEQRSL